MMPGEPPAAGVSWETTAIVASGPSLVDADVAHLQGRCRVIIINDNWRKAPWADLLYAADFLWWQYHIDKLSLFKGMRCTARTDNDRRNWPAQYGLQAYEVDARPLLCTAPGTLSNGGHGGHQAINLAFHQGARRILLLGYDMKPDSAGRNHWFGEHPPEVKKAQNYPGWIKNLAQMAIGLQAAGVEVINCTPGSAIQCWPQQPLTDVL